MAEFIQNANTKTFIDEVNKLVETSRVKNYKEVADAIEWDKTAISNVMNGRRNVPHEKYTKFTEVYKVASPVESGYREKYYTLLEQKVQEQDNIIQYLKEFATKITGFENSHKQLNSNLDKLQSDLLIQAAMNTAYQEWVIEYVGAGNSRKAMTAIRKKAVELLTSFASKGIGVDMGIVSNGK
jgi:hypothetical protein